MTAVRSPRMRLSLGAADIRNAPGIVPSIPATAVLMIPPSGIIKSCFWGSLLRINERLPKQNDDRAGQLASGMVSTRDLAAIVVSSAASMPLI